MSWSQIDAAHSYIHQDKYSSPVSFGLRIQSLDTLDLRRSTARKLVENSKRWGWHCYYHAESLLIPIKTVEQVVNFYRAHPEARWELVAGSALERIAAFEKQRTT